MTTSSGSTDRAVTGLVVMCCAGGDADPLAETVTTLGAEGNDVRIVAGLEEDTAALTDVIGELGGEGLYVLCRSPRLGREHVEKLREILLAHHVPFARTLTVAVGGRGALADRIRSGLRRASARGSSPSRSAPTRPARSPAPALPVTNATEDEEPTLVGRREHLMGNPAPVLTEEAPEPASPVSAEPQPPAEPPSFAAPEPEPPAITTEPEASAEPEPEPEPEASDEPEPEPETSARHQREEIENADTISSSRLSLSELDLSDLDDSIPGARVIVPDEEDRTMVGRPPPMITGNTVIGPAPVMITGETITGEKLPDRLREAAERAAASWPTDSPSPSEAAESADPATTPMPRLSREDFESKPQLPPPRSAPDTASPVAPSQASAAAPLVAPGPTTPEPPSHGVDAAPPAASAVSPPAPAAPPAASAVSPPAPAAPPAGPSGPTSTAGPGATRSSSMPLVLGAVAVLLLIAIITVAAWPSDDEPEVASSTPSASDTPESEAETKADPTPADAETADEPPPEAAYTPVLDALRSRKVRALDVLLVASEASDASDHTAAVAYCESLELVGITGWRLPHVGELNAMSDANMVSRGYYWSLTAADLFGDSYLAWNERRGNAASHSKDAVALCVRSVSGGGS